MPASGASLGTDQLLLNPLVAAASAHVGAVAATGRPLPAPESLSPRERRTLPNYVEAFASQLAHDVAEQVRIGTAGVSSLADLTARMAPAFRRYATTDLLGWAESAAIYLEYQLLYGGEVIYHDWRELGQDVATYGVLGFQLPDDARVALIGDWGTGLPDAVAMVDQILDELRPDVLIHLGDVYYSGLPAECRRNVGDPLDAIFARTGGRIPVLMIPGNHDYYAGGHGFYPLPAQVNRSDPRWQQAASYFCLRSASGAWQILGMDTGQGDVGPLSAAPPTLRASEVAWHRDKIESFGGSTILLSHHQPFSRAATAGPTAEPWVNRTLLEPFRPYFGSRIPAWFWGHEHSLAIFQNGLFDLPRGRLLGCSAYEEAEAEDPYRPSSDASASAIPFQPDESGREIRLPSRSGYFDHGFALLHLTPDAGEASYYAYPSWEGVAPEPRPALELLYREDIPLPGP